MRCWAPAALLAACCTAPRAGQSILRAAALRSSRRRRCFRHRTTQRRHNAPPSAAFPFAPPAAVRPRQQSITLLPARCHMPPAVNAASRAPAVLLAGGCSRASAARLAMPGRWARLLLLQLAATAACTPLASAAGRTLGFSTGTAALLSCCHPLCITTPLCRRPCAGLPLPACCQVFFHPHVVQAPAQLGFPRPTPPAHPYPGPPQSATHTPPGLSTRTHRVSTGCFPP